MDSAFIYRAANELVQSAGTRNIKQIARSCSLDISETSRIKDMLGLLSLYFDKPLILINRQLNKQTKQMVCGYALGHYLEHQLLMDLHTLDKFLTIKDKHILLYEHNAFTSHLIFTDAFLPSSPCSTSNRQVLHRLYYRTNQTVGMYRALKTAVAAQCLSKK